MGRGALAICTQGTPLPGHHSNLLLSQPQFCGETLARTLLAHPRREDWAGPQQSLCAGLPFRIEGRNCLWGHFLWGRHHGEWASGLRSVWWKTGIPGRARKRLGPEAGTRRRRGCPSPSDLAAAASHHGPTPAGPQDTSRCVEAGPSPSLPPPWRRPQPDPRPGCFVWRRVRGRTASQSFLCARRPPWDLMTSASVTGRGRGARAAAPPGG